MATVRRRNTARKEVVLEKAERRAQVRKNLSPTETDIPEGSTTPENGEGTDEENLAESPGASQAVSNAEADSRLPERNAESDCESTDNSIQFKSLFYSVKRGVETRESRISGIVLKQSGWKGS